MDKISVIIPVYKVEKYLNECVESVINQTYKNLEIILVDDGSPDNSGKMCDAFAKQDKRIVVIHKENGGLSSARNAGIEIATGKYLSFVDSDDYLDIHCFELLYNALKKSKADVSICGICQKYESGDPDYLFTLDNSVLTSTEALLMLKPGRTMPFVVAMCKLYSKNLFKELRYPLGKINEDQFLAHKIYLQCKNVATISECLYFYRIRSGSIMTSSSVAKHFDDLDAIFERIKLYKSLELNPELLYVTEELLFERFGYYYKKFIQSKKVSKYDIEKIKFYGEKCYAFFEECKQLKQFTKKEIKQRKKLYHISHLDKIVLTKFKFITAGNGKFKKFLLKIYHKIKRR